jgi:hypothetical protein
MGKFLGAAGRFRRLRQSEIQPRKAAGTRCAIQDRMLVEKTVFRSTKAQRIAQRIHGNREKKAKTVESMETMKSTIA